MESITREVKGAEPAAYADDTGPFSSSRRAVSKVVEVSAEFAALTGQQVNTSKSFAYSIVLVRHRPLRLGDGFIAWRDGMALLEARIAIRSSYVCERMCLKRLVRLHGGLVGRSLVSMVGLSSYEVRSPQRRRMRAAFQIRQRRFWRV